jgi:acyl carrier protein
MTIDEMIERCPDIVKITPEIMIEVSNTKLNLPLDINKTWVDNGYDDYDAIEMVMELEKRLDISITDDVVETFTQGGNKPPVFKSYLRNKKIEELGL